MAKKPKNVEEDTNRTAPVVPVVHQASRDDIPPPDEGNPVAQGSAPDKDTSDPGDPAEQEIQLAEAVDLDDPTPAAEPIDLEDMDDPRMRIAKKHDEKHRNFSENSESDLETGDPTDIIDAQSGDPEMVEIKIYGETRNVDAEKIDKMPGDTREDRIQAYQKQQAVDAGMQDNARQRDTLDNRAQALDERERQIANYEASLPTPGATQADPPEDPPTPGDQSIDELARKYQESVYDGEENAPELLAELVKSAKSQGTPIDESVIITRAADELERRTRRKNVTAATKMLIDVHPELNRESDQFDSRLWTAIDDETTVVERQNPEWEPQAVLDEAYNRVSNWKGDTHKTGTMTDKAASKRNMNRPRANSGRYTPPPPPPERTASDYVADLRKSRGQGA